VADLASATAARQTAVGGNTLDNEIRAWNRFSEYCKSIRLGDNFFLEDMSRTHRIEIIVMLPWLKAQSQIPSTMWLWSSGKTGTTTQNGTLSATLHNFYGVN
jgi:hypothetical protein